MGKKLCFVPDEVQILDLYHQVIFSVASEKCESVNHSVVSNSATPWIVAHQAPLSMEFSRQEYWSGLPFPPLGDLPNPGIKLRSPAFQADSLPSEAPG